MPTPNEIAAGMPSQEPSEPTYTDDNTGEQVTESELRGQGFVDGGKLLMLEEDNDIFMLLASNGRAYPLRVD